jgi:DNA recombination protein RmuC
MNIIYLLVGLCLGGALSWLYQKIQTSSSDEKHRSDRKALEAKVVLLDTEYKKALSDLTLERNKSYHLNSEYSKSQTRLEHLQEKLLLQKSDLDDLQTKFYKEFENLANRILEEKSEKFSRMNKHNLDELLKPLGEKIKDFEKKVEENIKDNIERHSSLKEQLFHLNQLNQQISKEANSLASALKGQVTVQGKWGEIILESILEKSGLVKNREYFVQLGIGQSRPDIVIQLPENKKLIVDSKVSLSAYEKYCSEEDEFLKSRHLKDHIYSLRSHIKNLGVKEYQNLFSVGSADFVLLFVPVEPAFNVAVMHDPEIFNEAFENNIVIVSTSTLLATLRTIASIWRQENQAKNVLQIAQESGALYDKFVSFLLDMEDIGKKISATQKSYDAAIGKLSAGGNSLITRAENIKRLGAKTSKSIPDIFIEDKQVS